MNIISDYLDKLGFGSEAVQLFTTLTQHGPMTLLQASRKTAIERTRLYRLVDELIDRGLIEDVPVHKRRTIQAASPATIKMMVKKQELTAQTLSDSFPSFVTALNTLIPQVPQNNVIYYHGIEGLRQMSWHMLRTKGLYYTYSYRFWNEILGAKFTLKLNEEMLRQKMKVHDIYSDQYFDYKKQWLKKHGHKPEGDWSFWKSRYIPEKILKVDQNIDIYNDVVAYYHWEGDETFGVEIVNQRIADFHKQIHNVIWKMAKPVPQLDWSKDWN